ncbi:TonB-dependent siderophore receptor [Roseateles aquatilis]|uniref:TonB-dependent siderophore receptor n=1 Tax=Roseateles aquatilis TaxID=431061 RepID=A0A2D0ALP0_9BURK|nr:TonB-dependent siderophore receptor [Roseateles aquatilis]OWQ82906.1 TonB-dependent siderophore receptor [Roseateles aquatilis]
MQTNLKAVGAAIAALLSSATYAQNQNGATLAQNDVDRAPSVALSTVTVQGSRIKQLPVSAGALGARSDLETPFSTRQVDAEDLENRQVKSLGKIFANDPAVMSLGDTYSFNAYSINVRGIPLDDYNGYKINGLPFFMTTVELPVETFESVQLLKGASGFMYGFGAPGGIINFVTKKPTDKPLLALDVGYRSDGVFSEHVDAGGRVDDGRYGYRLNLTHEQGETYNGADVLRNSASLSLDARLAPSLTWTADAIYQSRRVKGGVQDFFVDDFVGAAIPQAPSGRKHLSAHENTFFNSNVFFVSTGLQWKIDPAWSAKIDVSRSQDRRRYSGQWMGLLNEAGDYTVYLNKAQGAATYEQAQALIEGSFATGGLQHQVTVGLAWQGLNKQTVPKSLYTPIGTQNLYTPVTPLTWSGSYDDSLQYHNYHSAQRAVFASDTLQFSEAWSLLAGLRYSDYGQTSYTTTGAVSNAYKKTPVSPTLALMYRPRPDTLVYASYVEALEQGSTVGTTYANADEVLAPIKSRQYELGVKHDGRRWGATASVFQIEHGAEYANARNYYVSDGQVRLRGVEANGHVDLPVGVRLDGGLAWTAGTYRETDASLVGNRVEGIPKWQASLGVSGALPGVDGLSANAELHYDKRLTLDANNRYELPGYSLVNLGLSYRTRLADHPVTLRAGVDNVFNRGYWGFLQSGYIFAGTPRTVGLNAKIEL